MDANTWESMLESPPEQLTASEREQWLKQLNKVALSSDAFFPFRDNIDRARQVKDNAIFQPKNQGWIYTHSESMIPPRGFLS